MGAETHSGEASGKSSEGASESAEVEAPAAKAKAEVEVEAKAPAGEAAGEAAGGVAGEAASGAVSEAAGDADAAAAKPDGKGAHAEPSVPPRLGSSRIARMSRRFPSLTRDTARPEGGGRAAAGDAPAPARQWPLLSVLGGTGLGLLIVAFDAFRAGTIIIGLALIAGAVLRWALPSVGMLAVRSRFTDMVIYGALGAAIVLLSMMAQPHPWLKIPFLEDLLHFTVK